ncbi:MAG: hypothetical protein RI956_60 [Pseudomonadota bacterium]|jgi:MoxR-like ATPase
MTQSPVDATNTASVLKTPEQKQAFLIYVNNLLKNLIAQLNQGLVERDEAIKLTLLSVLAQENIVLVGPPDTGKSFFSP